MGAKRRIGKQKGAYLCATLSRPPTNLLVSRAAALDRNPLAELAALRHPAAWDCLGGVPARGRPGDQRIGLLTERPPKRLAEMEWLCPEPPRSSSKLLLLLVLLLLPVNKQLESGREETPAVGIRSRLTLDRPTCGTK